MIAPKKWYLGSDAKVDKGAHAGRSILEILWEELDSVMDRLMDDGEPKSENYEPHDDEEFFELDGFKDACKVWGEERGQAQGVAYAIAVMTNPYEVDITAIKQTAVERWESRQDG